MTTTQNEVTAEDVKRIKANLAFIAANPTTAPAYWIEDVKKEARAAGLIPAGKPVVGASCRPGIDAGIVYGGDMEDVF